MVLYCWVCKQSNCSNQNLSFHRFPADAHEKAVWLEKLGLKEFTETVSKYARIRSIHFKGEAFEIKPSGKIFLRKGAFFNEEYIPTTETASTSRLDNRKSSTDSTDTAPGTSCSDIIDSFGPPLKRFHSDTSATMTAPEIDTEYLSETLTASETELIQMSITEKETDRPTICKRKRQCNNGQRFRHRAVNCHAEAVCRHCPRNHESKEHPKDGDSQSKCANCDGAHESNYRGCPKFPTQENKEKPKPKRPPRSPRTKEAQNNRIVENTPLNELLSTLNELKDAGKLRKQGLSNKSQSAVRKEVSSVSTQECTHIKI
ncbi:hypothetical protein JTB14_002253 [Gonioctena quinquepunctata]|nr:hypothetical protein JTB14_002253 [Gonioctena quinquepunctata]